MGSDWRGAGRKSLHIEKIRVGVLRTCRPMGGAAGELGGGWLQMSVGDCVVDGAIRSGHLRVVPARAVRTRREGRRLCLHGRSAS